MPNTLYAFVSDVALINRTGFIEKAQDSDTLVGYFDDTMANYFNNPATVKDPRGTRLSIDGRVARLGMAIHFDYISESNPFPFNDMGDNELHQLFNILEYAAITQGKTETEIHEGLVTGGATYGVYAGSEGDRQITVTNALVTSTLTTTTNTTITGLNIPVWVEVVVTVGGADYTIKAWFGRESFLLDYPYCEITKIVFPIAVDYMVDPTGLSNVYQALQSSSSWTADVLDSEVTNKDHSGVVPYEVTFYSGVPKVNVGNLTFTVFYKGRTPTSYEVQEKIRGALITAGDSNVPQVAPEVWETIFPGLYVNGRFYIFPLWENIREADTELSGVVPLSYPLTAISTIMSDQTSPILNAKAEIVMLNNTQALLIAVPGPNNGSESSRIIDLYPDYQSLASTSLDPNTIAFKIALAAAVSVANGYGTGDIVIDVIDDVAYNFVKFTQDDMEFYVHCKAGVS